jgi:hypothetical protein
MKNYARQHPKFWLAYFVLSVVMLAINTVYDALINFGSSSIFSLIATSLAIIGLRPLYGYIRQRRYEPRWLWITLLFFYGPTTAVSVLICIFASLSQLILMPLVAAVVLIVFVGPFIFALHQYSYKSPHLWRPS